MGLSNVGNQKIIMHFAYPLNAADLNKTFKYIVAPGIYQGLEVTVGPTPTDVSIAVGKFVISDGTHYVFIENEGIATLTGFSLSAGLQYIVIGYEYRRRSNWYAEIKVVTQADAYDIANNYVIIGRVATWNSNTEPATIDTNVRQYGTKKTWEDFLSNGQVTESLTVGQVWLDAYKITNSNGIFESLTGQAVPIPENTSVPVVDKHNIVALRTSDGAIVVIEGTIADTDPDFFSHVPLARVIVPSGYDVGDPIYSGMITDIRPFLGTFVDDANAVNYDPTGTLLVSTFVGNAITELANDSAKMKFDPTGTLPLLTSTDVESVIKEIANRDRYILIDTVAAAVPYTLPSGIDIFNFLLISGGGGGGSGGIGAGGGPNGSDGDDTSIVIDGITYGLGGGSGGGRGGVGGGAGVNGAGGAGGAGGTGGGGGGKRPAGVGAEGIGGIGDLSDGYVAGAGAGGAGGGQGAYKVPIYNFSSALYLALLNVNGGVSGTGGGGGGGGNGIITTTRIAGGGTTGGAGGGVGGLGGYGYGSGGGGGGGWGNFGGAGFGGGAGGGGSGYLWAILNKKIISLNITYTIGDGGIGGGDDSEGGPATQNPGGKGAKGCILIWW